MLDSTTREAAAQRVQEVTASVEQVAATPAGSMLEVLTLLWRRRLGWAVFCAIGLVGGVVTAFLLPTVYRSSAAVVASSQIESSGTPGGMGALAGAARQLGISVGGAGSDPSALFVPILQSRRLAETVLTQTYTVAGVSSTLEELLIPDVAASASRREAAIRKFRGEVLRTGLSLESGVLTVAAVLPNPSLATQVVTNCVESLERINRESQSAQAARWVEFIQERLVEAEAELEASEEALQAFREGNRSILDSPKLQLEQARHVRNTQIAQEIFTTVKTQYELAKVEQMKNVPVLAVLDPAVEPVERYRPRRSFVALAGLFVGIVLGAGWILSRHYVGLLRDAAAVGT